MNPLTVLLWLLCVFIIAVFFGVISLFVYMFKVRKKALIEFNEQRAAMGLKPSNDVKAAMACAKCTGALKTHKVITKGTSQGG